MHAVAERADTNTTAHSSPFDSFGVSLLSAHSVPRPLNITPDQFSVFPTVSAVLFVSSSSIAHQHAPACRARDLHVEFLSVCSVPVFLCRFDCTYRHSSFYRATLCVSAVFAVAHSTPLHTVRLPRWWIVSRWLKKSSNFLFRLVAHHSIFLTPAPIPNSEGNPLSGGAKYTGVRKSCYFRLKSPFISVTVRDI